MLKRYNVSKAFVGVNGITIENGLTTPDLEEAEMKRTMLSIADERIILTDSTKFQKVARCQIAPISMIVAGMLIAGMDVKDCLKNKRLYIITFLKMFIFPCVAVSLLKFTNLSSMVKNGDMILLISLLASVAPTAASVTQIAQIYDADSEYASAYYFVTTLLCILTMPVFVWFYQL